MKWRQSYKVKRAYLSFLLAPDGKFEKFRMKKSRLEAASIFFLGREPKTIR